MSNAIEIRNLTMKFGELLANEDVSFDIEKNNIVSLIGPNGAGKTTLFNCATGFYKPFSGRVSYYDEDDKEIDITGRPTHEICKLGIARTFQIVKTLNEMTVEENVMTGAFLHVNRSAEAREQALEVLRRTGLMSRRNILGRNLTIAERKRVEIARALATKPRVLMLDECMAGLNQTEIKDVMNLILELKDHGITLLIVEHIMEAIMPISDKIVVLDSGRKIAEGSPQEIANNDEVIKAYLGEKFHAKSKKS
ncbi:MAG TPA: ABC transporter ATP-binding protein [Clostridiaceae bacterium]|nr:ABC transporter ATP-binding protein [Clostridiaceae bacterium]